MTWLSRENREALLVEVSMTLAFLALAVLIVVLTSLMVRTQRLQMENTVERSFNNIALAIQQNRTRESDILDDSMVGVGIYDSSGSLVMGWGSIYNMIPVATLSEEAHQSGNDTVVNFDSSTSTVEYIRFLRQPLPITSINFFTQTLGAGYQMQDPSTIIYLSFDGSGFVSGILLIFLVSIV